MTAFKGTILNLNRSTGIRRMNKGIVNKLPVKLVKRDYGRRVDVVEKAKNSIKPIGPMSGERTLVIGKAKTSIKPIGPMSGERTLVIGKAKSPIKPIGPMSGERTLVIGKAKSPLKLIGIMGGERILVAGKSSLMPSLFLTGGVRIPNARREGIFLQNPYEVEGHNGERILPRKEPLEAPWKHSISK
ncbi:hypothetical protein [Bacillus cereus]|uniref:hypothetical protein n=1 Tax=Bacillus cereus TaxID=1396 RepID=UPI001D1177DA|nr:hypothetical protein [Bacillus cereus]UDV85093.1 hypothetical protein HQJ03_028335 [Bacillus cereus]UDV90594.1 hypothetical protein HQG80_027940 [Bacillus cereus]